MSLGSLIVKARKDASFSIDELSQATNIRLTLLREIEADDFSHCGGDTMPAVMCAILLGHSRVMKMSF